MDQHRVSLPALVLVIALAVAIGVPQPAEAHAPDFTMYATAAELAAAVYGMDPFETPPATIVLAMGALLLLTTAMWAVSSDIDVSGIQLLFFVYMLLATTPTLAEASESACLVATLGTTSPGDHTFTPMPSGPGHPAALGSGVEASVNIPTFIVPADHGYAVQLENQCGEDIELSFGGTTGRDNQDAWVHLGDGTPVPVPELGTILLLGTGLLGIAALAVVRRRA